MWSSYFALRLILLRICKYLCNPISPVWLGFKQINKRFWKCGDMLSKNNANKVLREFILFFSLEMHMILSVNNTYKRSCTLAFNTYWQHRRYEVACLLTQHSDENWNENDWPIISINMTWINYLPFRTCSLSLWCMARLHWSLNGCLLRYCSRSEKQRVS